MTNGNGKSLHEVVTETKNELIEFFATRAQLLGAEMDEKMRTIKLAMPALVISAVLLLTAWLLLTACLVTLIAAAFTPPWTYVVALLIVGAVYLLVGMLFASTGWKKIKLQSLKPERTLRTLQQDRQWLQKEITTQL